MVVEATRAKSAERVGREHRAAAAALVARALGRSLLHRPIRLIAAVAGGIGGVVLTAAVLMIAVPVLFSTRIAPVEGLRSDVVAVAADAPAGMSEQLVTEVTRRSGADSSAKLLMSSTTAWIGGDIARVAVLGVDLLTLPAVLETSALGEGDGLVPLGAGQAYLSRSWAQAHGFAVGDRVEVTTPNGLTGWQVVALLDADLANRGATVVVPKADAAAAFDRGDTTDILLLRGADTEKVREQAAGAVAGAATVTSPSRIFDSYNRIFRTPLMLVAINAAIAILTGSVVLFLTWRLVLTDARPVLSRLRLVGVRDTDLVLGSGLVLLPILALTYVIGATAGCLLGRSLSSFRTQITNFTGQAFDPGLTLPIPLVGAFVAAVIMFGVAWLSGLWDLRRTTAIDAISGRDLTVTRTTRVRWLVVAGVGAYLVAAAVVVLGAGIVRALAVLPVLFGLALLSTVLPVLAGTLLRRVSTGASGLFIGRQLEVSWRRNAALGITFAAALFSSLTVVGGSASIRGDIDASMARVTSGDLFVAATPQGEGMAAEQLPVALRDRIARMPGVVSVDSFAQCFPVILGGRNMLEEIGGDAAEHAKPRVVDGPPAVLDGSRSVFDFLVGADVAISTGFAELHDLAVGSTLELPTTRGHIVVNVVALIDDSISDGGTVLAGREVYQQVGGSGLFSVGIELAPEADEAAVRAQLEQMVATEYPRATVLNLTEYRAGLSSILGRLMNSFIVFAWVMFAIAGVVGIATLASSLSERARGLALTRLIGGPAHTVRRLVGAEAIVIVAITWLLSVPAALVGIPAMLGGQSLVSGLRPPVLTPYTMIAVSLPASVLAVCLALVLARRSVAAQSLSEVLVDE
ncbi:FtsX-like permease family protein [Nocardia takedensis]